MPKADLITQVGHEVLSMSNDSKKAPSPRILIVEKDLDIIVMLADLFKTEGYLVDAVGTGLAALVKVPQKTYSAVILEMNLPDLSGVSVLKALVGLRTYLPVIILTAAVSQELRQECFYNGAFAYFTKPFDFDELKRMVREAVALGRGNQG